MIVVSDASPLIVLGRAGHLDVLRRLYGEVLVPVEVHREATADVHRPGAAAVRACPWLRVVVVKDRARVDGWARDVDAGEAEALALAVESGAALTLMDDARGRRLAVRLGIAHTGTLGVMIEARRSGHIPALAPVLDTLAHHAFRLHPSLRARALAAVGEPG